MPPGRPRRPGPRESANANVSMNVRDCYLSSSRYRERYVAWTFEDYVGYLFRINAPTCAGAEKG